MEQNFYHKLLSIPDQFGISATKVIVANTYEHSAELDKLNDAVEERGTQMNIITIRELKDIKNIGTTQRAIIERKTV